MKLLFLLVIGISVSGILGKEKWSNLKVTYGFNPKRSFNSLPRTAEDAEKTGWRSISDKDCTNGGTFFGHRYINGDDVSVSLLFDRNGIIAGIQMNLLKNEILNVTPNNTYRFESVAMFHSNVIKNQDVFTLTAYFVQPDSICTAGRSNHELENQGTGTMLQLQNGPTPADLIKVPLMRSQAIKEGWSKNNCFYGMGYHNFYKVDEVHKTNCTDMRPVFLLYNKRNELLGFGFASTGYSTSKRFEHPSSSVIKSIVGKSAPQCMLNIADTLKFSTMHVYFIDRPYWVNCWF